MPVGSRFYRKVPVIKVGSCSIIVTEDLSYVRLYYWTYLLFISNLPYEGSTKCKRQL